MNDATPVVKDGTEGVIRLVEGQRFDETVMKMNVPKGHILHNIRANIRRHLPQMCPMMESPVPVIIVGGGWSLKKPAVWKEFKDLVLGKGYPVVALNGAAKWLYSQNIRPALHIILDARPDNVVFLPDEPIERCLTFLASQCDPVMFDTAEARGMKPTIFHAVSEDSVEENDILNTYYGPKRWMRIPPCGALGASSHLLLRTQGFRFQHAFGLDSCYDPDDGSHHAFPQPLNDNEDTALFKVGKEGRVFRCSAWQAAQARSFLKVVIINGEHLQLHYHGDGLLGYLLQLAAEQPLPDKEEKKE